MYLGLQNTKRMKMKKKREIDNFRILIKTAKNTEFGKDIRN